MADPAEKPDLSEDGIVDLQNDARWLARLEEARARRIEALKRSGRDDNARRAPSKPWEEENAPVRENAPRAVQDSDHSRRGGIDFNDRMSVLRKRLDADKVEKSAAPASQPRRNSRDTQRNRESEPKPEQTSRRLPRDSVDSLFSDPIFEAPEILEAKPKLVDPIDLKSTASDPQPWRRGWAELEQEEASNLEHQDAEIIAPIPDEPKWVAGGMPHGMALAMLLLAALPFTTLLPPLERGPVQAQALGFAIQPAYGITGAMLERPEETRSTEWTAPLPITQVVPEGALQAAPPAFSRLTVFLHEPPEDTGDRPWSSLSALGRSPIDADGRGPNRLPPIEYVPRVGAGETLLTVVPVNRPLSRPDP